ncbi:MAG: hypothetical protein AMXMBFR58_33700 [Phycisphaerae bacterium]
MVPVGSHQIEPVDIGHDQVLQDDRRPGAIRHVQGVAPDPAVVELEPLDIGEQPAEGFGDDELIIHQQDDGTLKVVRR